MASPPRAKRHGGIDEAGFGPPLGPLVAAATTWDAPADAPGPWTVLDPVVVRRPGLGRPAICDSKLLHAGPRPFARLEASVLPFLYMAGREDLLDDWPDAPWYDPEFRPALPPVPTEGVAALRERIRERGCAPPRILARPVEPDAFNRVVGEGWNKADLLWKEVAVLLDDLLTEGVTEIRVDRLGGRKFYAQHLQEIRPNAYVRILRETQASSRYVVETDPAPATVAFDRKADRDDFSVALASCVAKYVRERRMIACNAFWCAHVPGLRRTAGYPEDARRFLEEIEPMRRSLDVPIERLVRTR